MLPPQACGVDAEAICTAHAFNTVRDDGFAVTGTTKNDCAFTFATANRFSRWADVHRIIARGIRMGAEVMDVMAKSLDFFDDEGFVSKTGVVRGYGNMHDRGSRRGEGA